jgi:hypothetical protein
LTLFWSAGPVQETEPASADERPNLHSLLDESGEPAVSDAVVVKAEPRSIITIQCWSVKTTRMVRHPAALLLLSLRLLLSLLLLLSLRMLLSLWLPPRWRPGRSGAGMICVLCTAIKTLQCKKQSEGERKMQQYGFGSPERKQCKHRTSMRCSIRCN